MYVTFNTVSVLHQSNDSVIDFMCAKFLYAFPIKGVILKTTSPSMIVEGKPNPYFNPERIVFVSHA